MPRFLRALCIDREHMCTPDTGSVARVFDRAAHLKRPDGSLTFITVREMGDGPRGIRLDTPDSFSFRDHLKAGDAVAFRGSWLRLGREGLKIDLRAASGWQPGEFNAPLPSPAAAQIPEVVSGPERNSLRRATRDACLIDTIGILGPHIGLGPGLTPTGDDFTVGYLAGLHAYQAAICGRRDFVANISSWLGGQLVRTSDVAATYLEAASRGVFSDVVRAYATRPDSPNLKRLLGFGDSSGAAVVDGYLVAAQSWGQLRT